MIIFLVGYMGSGKSYWGKRWAENYHLDFVDLDLAISETEKCSLSEIFERYGEDGFRKRESRALRMYTKPNTLIACGGGTACFWDNMKWMNQQGITLYLQASANYLQKNIEKENDTRPLIKNSGEALHQFILQQLANRIFDYQQANYFLDAEELQVNSLHKIMNDEYKK